MKDNVQRYIDRGAHGMKPGSSDYIYNMTATIWDLDVYQQWFSNSIPTKNTTWHFKYNPDWVEQYYNPDYFMFFGRLATLADFMPNKTLDAVRACVTTNAT